MTRIDSTALLEEFRNYLIGRRRSPHTVRVRMTYLRQLHAMHTDLMACTLTDLEGLLKSHPEWKPETANAALASIRSFYKWASRHAHTATNPAEYLDSVYVPRAVKVLADDDAIRGALAVATPREEAMIRLGRECGLRRAEIASLHTRSRDGEWLTVTGKGNRTRRLNITANLLAALVTIEEEHGLGYYFPGHGSTLDHVRPETVYVTVLRLTGTPTHALRRRAATSVYQGTGNDIRATQEFLGHSSPSITAGYIHISDDDLRRAGSAATL